MKTDRRKFIQTTTAGIIASLGTPLSSWAQSEIKHQRSKDELIDFDALGLAELIKTKKISARELTEHIIRRVEAIDPIINSINTRTFERARGLADKIPVDSTFAGVPILIKDMVDVGGVRRTDGSRLMLSNVPEKNVAYIDGVEDAGMNILGMTNVPEFAQLGIVTNNTAFGMTKTPWDLSKSTLGSSGGSAAAVAAGIVPLAHGTDGGGSNRLPACVNGLFGMKPSRARMLSGEADGGHNPFKTNQAISRTVRDSAALMSHTEDKSGKIFEPIGLISGPSNRRLKIGLATEMPGGMKVDAVVVEAIEKSAKLLETLGHEVVPIDMPINSEEFFRNYNGAFLRRFGVFAEMATGLTGFAAADSGLLDPWSASLIAYGARVTDEQQQQGLEYLAKVPGFFANAFEKVDVIMSPVLPVTSVKADALRPSDKATDSNLEFLQHRLAYTAPTNVAGVPAMSVPLGWHPKSGLPIGTMFQAAMGDDKMLYELAFELELAQPWKDRWAPYSVKNIPI